MSEVAFMQRSVGIRDARIRCSAMCDSNVDEAGLRRIETGAETQRSHAGPDSLIEPPAARATRQTVRVHRNAGLENETARIAAGRSLNH